MTRPIQSALATWHEIAKAKDVAAIPSLLADDVVFYSPVVHTPQRGRKITSAYLGAALHVFGNDTFQYIDQIEGVDRGMLEFQLELDGTVINGVDIISANSDGLITEFKVMLRPLQAIQLIHRKMGEMLERRKAQA